MKYVTEFRDPKRAAPLLARIQASMERIQERDGPRPVKLMEVCGGHTHSIFKFGLERMLPPALEFVHGPGCPVCVLPVGRIDDAVAIAESGEVIFTTFGDAMRVPGSKGSLLSAKARGADVRTVYSPSDALLLARQHPERQVVFFGIGFETTVPSTALTVLEAASDRIENFSVFSNHITIVPTIKAILDSPDLDLDGFVGPGHVAMVTGTAPFRFVAERYRKPLVISGFEPLDVLQSVAMLIEQVATGSVRVENQYKRCVRGEGNAEALRAMAEVFTLRPFFEWRGLGSIAQSGLTFKAAYRRFDAERRFGIPGVSIADPKACQCGEVLKGAIKPWKCKVFGTACTPQTPIGSCMVSSEGACAAYYNFGRLHTIRRAAPK